MISMKKVPGQRGRANEKKQIVDDFQDLYKNKYKHGNTISAAGAFLEKQIYGNHVINEDPVFMKIKKEYKRTVVRRSSSVVRRPSSSVVRRRPSSVVIATDLFSCGVTIWSFLGQITKG